MSDVRFALCHAVRSLQRPVAAVAREFGVVSRKTAHKWLNVYDHVYHNAADAAAVAPVLVRTTQGHALHDHRRSLPVLPVVAALRRQDDGPRAFGILWDVFADAGLPQAILSDNAFNTPGIAAPGLSWFDARASSDWGSRPRTAGPITRRRKASANGSTDRPSASSSASTRAMRPPRDHFNLDAEHGRAVSNTLRPHEALGDRPPIAKAGGPFG